MTSSPNVSARDAALRKLTRFNHWLIAGSLTLAGVFSAVAAEAHPGQTVKTTSSTPATRKSGASVSHEGSAATLRAAAQAPSSAESSSSSEGSSAQESSATTESSTPVVSGGS